VADLSKLVKELSGLTVLDAVELTEALADKWGVNHGQKANQTGIGTEAIPNEAGDIKLIEELIFQPRNIALQRFSKEETAKGKHPISSSSRSQNCAATVS
jgi:hypothetical protein